MTVQVFVKNLEDQKFGVTVDPYDTVDKFKVKIQQKTGLKPEEQKILFGGKWLVDGKVLTDYNIQDGSVFHLVKDVKGGQ